MFDLVNSQRGLPSDRKNHKSSDINMLKRELLENKLIIQSVFTWRPLRSHSNKEPKHSLKVFLNLGFYSNVWGFKRDYCKV